MDNQVIPIFRTPITDIFANLCNFQNHPTCWKHELEVIDCLEAYGQQHAKEKCRELLNDFRECVLMGKQKQRIIIMRSERFRQVNDGERDAKDTFAKSPKMDTY